MQSVALAIFLMTMGIISEQLNRRSVAMAGAMAMVVTGVLTQEEALAPITRALCRSLELDPRPFIISQVIASIIGGTATVVGASANIVGVSIAEREGHHVGLWGFARVSLPVAVGTLVIATVYVWLRYLM